jgi:glycine C-acetyltransferase/8-amino-7-oxononanoate synthase
MALRMEGPVGPRTLISGREVDYFSGTGYLGLQNDPRVLQAAAEALKQYGLSTATSRGGYGEHPLFDAIEGAAAAFFGTEHAAYLPSGYLGAAILAQGLQARYDAIFIDSQAHFSIWDAARSTSREIHTFEHCEPESLRAACRKQLRAGQRPLVLSDGVFPISGEVAPAREYLDILESFDGVLALDDAHAAGVIGPHGRGTLDYWNIDSSHAFSSATLSKALGGFGGILPGSRALLQELGQHSRIPDAVSPPPLPIAAAAAQGLKIAAAEPERREALWRNVRQARTGLRQLGWVLPDLPVPIICLCARPGVDLGQLKAGLFERGIAIAHVTTYSSTPTGGALRIAIFATHTPSQIDRLVTALAELLSV